ncbi:efflux RND transporter permease subunit [Chrysiogenes arsenatis]|uniref:efflux RND transporter permease subunit n=1 Tax=Chrysiogenes arsenatis TaxID=309797 RepID=UPI000410787A|nr:efflux RND transporter permease subunit [Chrysiogenes arsenatis]
MNSLIRWMTSNRVAANLLMVTLLIVGAIVGSGLKQEIFPEIVLDTVRVSVAYPGAAPGEVEDSLVIKIEEAIGSLSGIKRVRSQAAEGLGVVNAEIREGVDVDLMLQEIKGEVDRIDSFPEEALQPMVVKVDNRQQVISIALSGALAESQLRAQAELIRDELLALPDITLVEIGGTRAPEIAVEIEEATLRQYALTLEGVAKSIGSLSLDLPGGSIRAAGGDILVRTAEKRLQASAYENLPILAGAAGEQVLLGDIATVRESFVDVDLRSRLGGQSAVTVAVYRVGNQKPIAIADTVKEYVERKQQELPPTVQLAVLDDRAEILKSRMNLLLRNGAIGLILVLVTLGLFLDLRLAFWTTMGIPISFLGALMVLPMADVSINMVSLFAFILALGIVVDDAIVVGENIYTHRQMGKKLYDAAIDGTLEVAGPVIFSILTSVAAFAPMLLVTGMMGKFIIVIPVVVISVLLISLVEALLILPAHLSGKHANQPYRGPMALLERVRQKTSAGLEWFVAVPYAKALNFCLEWRYATVASAVVLLALVLSLVIGGVIKFTFMPKVDADIAKVQLMLPYGSPFESTLSAAERLEQGALRVLARLDAEAGTPVSRALYTVVGSYGLSSSPQGGAAPSGGHLAEVQVHLVPSDERMFGSQEFLDAWREAVGEIAGVRSLNFSANLASFGAPVDVALSHRDHAVLEQATRHLKQTLETLPGVTDIADTLQLGKRELAFTLEPAARSLGITAHDLARQLRAAFYGAEALSIQRGRDEVKVMVRYPEAVRRSPHALEQLMIRNSAGVEIPLYQAARMDDGTGYYAIDRIDRRRVLSVTADVREPEGNSAEIAVALRETIVPALVSQFPGLSVSLEGESKERRESFASLGKGFAVALFLIYALLAVLFRSYFQPVIVMCAIPFGIIGGLLGHIIMGYDLSMLSLFGMVALSGVVVNDSLIMIDFINSRRREGMPLWEAVCQSGQRRFRPILLTSLTTFLGLWPMIFETSVQARFLIPMAISLGFGIIFATAIILVLIPSLYLITYDVVHLFQKEAEIEGAAGEAT